MNSRSRPRHVVVAALLASTAIAAQQPSPPAPPPEPRVSIDAFRAMQARMPVLALDVRAASAFSEGHIPGAMHVPYGDLERRARDIRDRAGRGPIVTYCSCPAEHTSLEAARVLRSLGFDDVSALAGGFPGWVASGGAIARGYA